MEFGERVRRLVQVAKPDWRDLRVEETAIEPHAPMIADGEGGWDEGPGISELHIFEVAATIGGKTVAAGFRVVAEVITGDGKGEEGVVYFSQMLARQVVGALLQAASKPGR